MEQGEHSYDVLYTAVGKALSHWERVEYMMALLYAHLVGGHQNTAAERAYGTIQSARGRREALEAAAQVFFFLTKTPQSERDQFDLLMSHYSQAAPRRNDIAHGIVNGIRIGDEDKGKFLVPPHYATAKNKKLSFEVMLAGAKGFDTMTHDYRYVSADIEHFIRRFNDLWSWTTDVWQMLLLRQPPR